jgi:hypothetical protein
MAISRVLFQHFARKVLGMIIYLTRPAIAGRAPIPQLRDVVRRYPKIKSDRLSFLCFVLHRMGFFLPRESLRKR